jgi:hypothetical protein
MAADTSPVTGNVAPITERNHACCEHVQADLHALLQMIGPMYALFTANRPVLDAMARGSLAGAAGAARRARKNGDKL